MSCAILSEHQAEAATAKSCTKVRILIETWLILNLSSKSKFQLELCRLQEQQFNRRRAAAMNIRMQAISQASVSQNTPGGSKEEMSPGSISPAQGNLGGMGSPHHSGMKPGIQKPPAAVLQVVKQVNLNLDKVQIEQYYQLSCSTQQIQAEAGRQSSHASYGKLNPTGTMHPPGMRMQNHMNPNVSKPQLPNVNTMNTGQQGMMNEWNNGPRFPGQQNNQIRPNNPNQIMQQQSPMQVNQVRIKKKTLECSDY